MALVPILLGDVVVAESAYQNARILRIRDASPEPSKAGCEGRREAVMKVVSRLLVVTLAVIVGLAVYFSRGNDTGQVELAAPAVESPPPPPPEAQIDTVTVETPQVPVVQASHAGNPDERRTFVRSMTEWTNPDIGEALGLSAGETELLLDMLVAHQEDTISSVASVGDMLGSLRESPEDAAALMSARMQVQEAELRGLLGERYSRWKDYNSMLRPAWQLRRDVRLSLEAAGMPMTEAQSSALINALEDEVRAAFAEAGQGTGGMLLRVTGGRALQLNSERRQRLLAGAAQHLAPLQLEAYGEVLERAGGTSGIFRGNGRP